MNRAEEAVKGSAQGEGGRGERGGRAGSLEEGVGKVG